MDNKNNWKYGATALEQSVLNFLGGDRDVFGMLTGALSFL